MQKHTHIYIHTYTHTHMVTGVYRIALQFYWTRIKNVYFRVQIFVCLFTATGQDPPMEVSIDGPTKKNVTLGDEIELVCSVNRDVSMSHKLNWYFQSLADPDAAEVQLAHGADLLDGASTDDFKVEYKNSKDAEVFYSHLTILSG